MTHPYIKRNKTTTRNAILLSSIICIISFILAISFGSSSSNLADLFQYILSDTTAHSNESAPLILMTIRIPRALLAGLCGAALAAAGVISQGLFRNPLASPTILGTSSGATLTAAVVFYLGTANNHWLTIPIAAFFGAIFSTSFVFNLAKKTVNWDIEHLLLTGVALSSLFGALTSLIISLSLEDYQKTAATMHWMLGGFSARGWEHIKIAIFPFIIGLILTFKLSGPLNVLVFGEEVAKNLSVNIAQLRKKSILAISLLVGTSVSVAGALPFIGLVIPHITRKLVGPEQKRLLLISALNGASITILADLIARTIRSPLEFEVGILTSLLGAPFFLWIILSRKPLI
ncbi:MAG: iron ABC transporter permease [Bdellovibrionota bacterium]